MFGEKSKEDENTDQAAEEKEDLYVQLEKPLEKQEGTVWLTYGKVYSFTNKLQFLLEKNLRSLCLIAELNCMHLVL